MMKHADWQCSYPHCNQCVERSFGTLRHSYTNVRGVIDRRCGVVRARCVVVGTTSGMVENAMLEWSGSSKMDIMTSITSISVVLGLRVTCTVSLVDRLAVSVIPLVSSVSLTSESKLNCGQCLMKCWKKCNSVVNVSLVACTVFARPQ